MRGQMQMNDEWMSKCKCVCVWLCVLELFGQYNNMVYIFIDKYKKVYFLILTYKHDVYFQNKLRYA